MSSSEDEEEAWREYPIWLQVGYWSCSACRCCASLAERRAAAWCAACCTPLAAHARGWRLTTCGACACRPLSGTRAKKRQCACWTTTRAEVRLAAVGLEKGQSAPCSCKATEGQAAACTRERPQAASRQQVMRLPSLAPGLADAPKNGRVRVKVGPSGGPGGSVGSSCRRRAGAAAGLLAAAPCRWP